MKFSTRQLVTMAVFGTLWGLMEISVGSVLNAAKMPLSGLILSTTGLLIAMMGRLFVPARGSTLFTGVIAMILKLFSIGSIIIGPMLGILAEALIAELILSAFSRPTQLSFILASAGGSVWPLFQPMVSGVLIFGRDLATIWNDLLNLGNRLFGLSTEIAVWIVLALASLHLLAGSLGGWLAWRTGNTLKTRLGRNLL